MDNKEKNWALILGGTGGFGLATAKILAVKGFNLILIYRERKSNLHNFEHEFKNLETACEVVHYNLNANESENQSLIIEELKQRVEIKGKVVFMLHALADGNLRPLFPKDNPDDTFLNAEDFQHTIQAMGTSLLHWSRLLYNHNIFAASASVVGLTSEGTYRVFPDYAAVASAKAVMEASMRYMAVELSRTGIRVNLINAGITDTNALKVFPGYKDFIEKAKKRNPGGRLTTTDDVAKVIAFLASPDAGWINGSVITVDGGEQLISLY
jgi:enoyl-[acyl-carrier protein] reductase III